MTTCKNFDCKLRTDCHFSIWDAKDGVASGAPCDPQGCIPKYYQSSQQRIYRDYEKKCKAGNEKPMSFNRYFEF